MTRKTITRQPPRLVYQDDFVRLYHGAGDDALITWDDEPVRALITDPPYSSGGQYRGDRAGQSPRAKYQTSSTVKTYADFSGDNRDQRGYTRWLCIWIAYARSIMLPGAPAVLFADWRQVPATTDGFQAGGLVQRGIGAWDKTEGARPQKGRPRAQCEFVIWGSHGPMRQDGPCLPGCWRYPVVGAQKLHLTEKPLALMLDICRIVQKGPGVVLDPFAGSGTTLLACRALGLRAVGYEINAEICDVARARLSGGGTPTDAAAPLLDLMAADSD